MDNIRSLLESKDFCETLDENENTFLHLVLNEGDIELDLIKLLLEKGLNVNAKNKFGFSPLQYAVSNPDCNVDVVKVLLDRGANIQQQDNNGNSALHHVLRQTDCNVIKLLIEKGADVNTVNNDGDSPLNHALTNSKSEPNQENNEANFMARKLDILKLLLERDLELDFKNDLGNSPLHYAVHNCHQKQDLIRLLLRNGADLNLGNNRGEAALHHAVKTCNVDFEVIELLLDYGADVNATNNCGDSPLCLAVNNPACLQDTLKLLLDQGADVLACNQSGDLPLQRAIRDYDQGEITVDRVKLLIKYTLATSLGFNLNALIKPTKHYPSLSKFAAECMLELIAMGSKKVANIKYPEYRQAFVVTLYEFMRGYQLLPPLPGDLDENSGEVWNNKKNAQSNMNMILAILQGKKFPLYNEVISAKVQRKDMIDKLMRQFIFTVRNKSMIFLDFYSVCGIAKYLSNDDLLNWIMAYHGLFDPPFLILGLFHHKKILGKRGRQEIEKGFECYKKAKCVTDEALNSVKKSKILIE